MNFGNARTQEVMKVACSRPAHDVLTAGTDGNTEEIAAALGFRARERPLGELGRHPVMSSSQKPIISPMEAMMPPLRPPARPPERGVETPQARVFTDLTVLGGRGHPGQKTITIST